VVFIGVRGSGETPNSAELDMGPKVHNVYNAFAGSLLARDFTFRIRPVGISYPAAPVSAGEIASGHYFQSIDQGVAEVLRVLAAENASCGHDRPVGEKRIVLAGYSQGALAVRMALARAPANFLNRVAAVVLVADPGRRHDELLHYSGTAPRAVEGIYTDACEHGVPLPVPLKPSTTACFGTTIVIPGSVSDRTSSLCNAHDLVCAPDFRSFDDTAETLQFGVMIHTGYGIGSLAPLGSRAAGLVS
jgi:hypothetical protein